MEVMITRVVEKTTLRATPAHLFCRLSLLARSPAIVVIPQSPSALPRSYLLLAILCLAFNAGKVSAQEDGTVGIAEETAATPEEMIITGERPMYQLREELWSAEQEAYAMFNEVNDEPRFNIHCQRHEPTGTRIKRQVCTPRFQLEATREHAQNWFYSAGQFVPLETQIASQMQEYRNKMKEVAEEHPVFLEAIIRYTALQERYKLFLEAQ